MNRITKISHNISKTTTTPSILLSKIKIKIFIIINRKKIINNNIKTITLTSNYINLKLIMKNNNLYKNLNNNKILMLINMDNSNKITNKNLLLYNKIIKNIIINS